MVFTRDQLPKKAAILIALLLGMSLCTFIFFEVFKMVFAAKSFMQQRELIMKPLPPDQFLRKLAQFRSDADARVLQLIMPIWRIVMLISVVSALSAIALLFYNFTAILVGLPLWPL